MQRAALPAPLRGNALSAELLKALQAEPWRFGFLSLMRRIGANAALDPIGTARLLPDGHIGRVSVLKDWRGLKVGDKLLRAAISEAENRGLKQQMLSAQVHASSFYERFGFAVVSGEFLDAGIPHVDMVRNSH